MLNEFFYGSSGGVTPPQPFGDITGSLRFNLEDNSYLARTPSVEGNKKTFTYSAWCKINDPLNEFDLFISKSGVQADKQFEFHIRDNILRASGRLAGSGHDILLRTTAVYRDFSAWYHVVLAIDTTQSTPSDRAKLYVNGVRVTDFADEIYPSQDELMQVGNKNTQSIGRRFKNSGGSAYSNGYIAEVNFIDGQALDPTSFGAYDINGVWQAAEYTGTYGSQGFHLDFSYNSSAAALGADSSGNGNDFTVNNISVTEGAENDSLVDSPINSTQTDTGLGGEVSGNYCTLNPLDLRNGGTLSNGNLFVSLKGNSISEKRPFALGTFAPLTGKWYFEVTVDSFSSSSRVDRTRVGIADLDVIKDDARYGTYIYGGSGNIQGPENNLIVSGLTAVSVGDVIGIAYDLDSLNFNVYLNGTANGSTPITAGRYAPMIANSDGQTTTGTYTVNFGQRPFAYPISGYKCLNSASLPEPTVPDGSKYFDTKLYTGNGSTQTISGFDFSPDFVWVKQRNTSRDHRLANIISGTGKDLRSNATNAEVTDANGITAFSSDGFSVGSNTGWNQSSGSYVAWAWDAGTGSPVTNNDGTIESQVRANPSAGFSIVSYRGTDTLNASVGHGINAAPKLIIIKNRDVVTDWRVYDTAADGSLGRLALNTTEKKYDSNHDLPTNLTFTITDGPRDGQPYDYIAYCFAPVEGYSAFGSYTGNGSTDGPFVHTALKPRFVMLKQTSGTGNWEIFDTSRDINNIAHKLLLANESNAESNLSNRELDILSNGFKIRSTNSNVNTSSETYIYATFAENPFSSNGGVAR